MQPSTKTVFRRKNNYWSAAETRVRVTKLDCMVPPG